MKSLSYLSFVSLLCIPLFLVSCGGEDESLNTDAVQANFAELSSDVVPVVDSAIEGLLNNRLRTQDEITTCEDDWTCNNVEQGNIAYQLYRVLADANDDPTLQDYPDIDLDENDDDEPDFNASAWGVENLQNELDLLEIMAGTLTGEDAGSQTADVQGDSYASELEARSEFTTLHAFDPMPYTHFTLLNDAEYQYYRTVEIGSGGGQDGSLHLAWQVDGDVTNLLVGNMWENEQGGAHERALYVAEYDESTSDLTMEVAMWTEQGFLPQWQITGDPETHSFTAKYLKQNVGNEGGYNMAFVGVGVSQGEGEYFLFKIKEWEGESTYEDAEINYYCVSAEATREDFGVAYGNGGPDEFNNVDSKIVKSSSLSPEGGWGCDAYEDDITSEDFLSAGGTEESDFDSEFLDNL